MKRLEEIEARLNAATPGSWELNKNARGFLIGIKSYDREKDEIKTIISDEYDLDRNDAELIINIPSDIRALLDAVKVMRETLDLIAETKTKTLLGRCCVDNACYKDEDGCSATVTAHNAFYQNASLAQQARAKVRSILGD